MVPALIAGVVVYLASAAMVVLTVVALNPAAPLPLDAQTVPALMVLVRTVPVLMVPVLMVHVPMGK